MELPELQRVLKAHIPTKHGSPVLFSPVRFSILRAKNNCYLCLPMSIISSKRADKVNSRIRPIYSACLERKISPSNSRKRNFTVHDLHPPRQALQFCLISQMKMQCRLSYAKRDADVFSLAAPANNYILLMTFRGTVQLFLFCSIITAELFQLTGPISHGFPRL